MDKTNKTIAKKLNRIIIESVRLIEGTAKNSVLSQNILTDTNTNLKHNEYWIIFNNENHPYLFTQDVAHDKYETTINGYLFDVLANNKEFIADITISRQNNKGELELLSINNERYLQKGIGSQLINLAYYISAQHKAKILTGYASAFTDLIDQQNLLKFYSKNEFKILKSLYKNNHETDEFHTHIYNTKLKDISKRIITYVKGNTAIKTMLPKNANKKEILNYIKALSKFNSNVNVLSSSIIEKPNPELENLLIKNGKIIEK